MEAKDIFRLLEFSRCSAHISGSSVCSAWKRFVALLFGVADPLEALGLLLYVVARDRANSYLWLGVLPQICFCEPIDLIINCPFDSLMAIS